MSTLNNRIVQVEIGKQGGEGLLLTNHRIDFTILYSSASGEPPKSTVKIYNPPPGLVQDLRSDGDNFLRLSAGYGGTASPIFAGRPVRTGLKMSQTGADWVLEVKALSGGDAYRSARVSESLGGSASFKGLVQDVIEGAGLAVGTLDLEQAPRDVPRMVFEGSSFRLLERLATLARCEIEFDGTTVHFLQSGVGIPEGTESVPVLSSENGTLIGQPVETEKGLTVRGLMLPDMRVGRRFQVKYFDPYAGEKVTVVMIAKEVQFKGSTWTNDFYVDLIGHTPKSGEANKSAPTAVPLSNMRGLMAQQALQDAKEGAPGESPYTDEEYGVSQEEDPYATSDPYADDTSAGTGVVDDYEGA